MTAATRLARAGLVVSGAFFISRVLGWFRLVVFARLFEASDLDTFFAAFRIPDLIFQLVAAGALSSALIPIVAGLLERDEEARAWRVVSTVINLMLIALAVLAVVLFVLAPVVMRVMAPGFEGEKLDQTVELTRIMLLSPIFLAMGAVATSVLNAGGRFAASAIAPIVYNLAIIGGALILAPSLGVAGLAIGVVGGSLGHLLVQLRPLRLLGFRYQPRIESDDPEARRALLLMAPRAFGLGAGQVTFIVVTALASTIGAGAVTDFNYAFTLLQIPIGVIGVPLGIVLLPSLSRDAAVGRELEFAALLTRALRLLVFVMIPIAGLGAVLRHELTDLLFGGGRIDAADLDLIAVDAPVVPDRPRGACADRRPGPRLLRPPGHAHPGARRGCGRGHQHDPRGAARRAARPWGDRPGHRRRRLGGGDRAARDPPPPGRDPPVRRARSRRRSRPPSGRRSRRPSRSAPKPCSRGAVGSDPSAFVLVVVAVIVTAVFGVAYAGVAVVLRIAELASIVEVMADLIRRVRRS